MSQKEFSFTKLNDLEAAGLLPTIDAEIASVADRYAIGITPNLFRLIDRTDPNDPIALQFLPDRRELDILPHENADPIGDHAHEPAPGVIHRYPDRVLFKAVSVCPVYCRFCFRREMVGPGHVKEEARFSPLLALDYVAAHPEIWEVIMSGGDPFMLSARRARDITSGLEKIPHVKVIRWHTRMPVADPGRINDVFVASLRSKEKATFVAVHVNHPRELSKEMIEACGRLIDSGIPVLSQSVLLRGVNDNLPTLSALMRGLVAARIKPYYIHQLDAAPGTSRFHVPIETARKLALDLRDHVSGLCQPSFVIDIPGGVSKAIATPADIRESNEGFELRGRDGLWRKVE
jgi:lysine 2,3-aminomutase